MPFINHAARDCDILRPDEYIKFIPLKGNSEYNIDQAPFAGSIYWSQDQILT